MSRVYRFDFGEGEPAEGFIKVTGSDIYTGESGFGIAKAAASAVKRKGEKAVLRDYLEFDGNVFRIRLDNGFYRLRVCSGDYDDIGDVTTVFDVNGVEMRFWIHEDEVKSAETVIDVKGSMLEIKAVSGSHICLNTVEIAPYIILKETNARAEVSASLEKQSVRLMWDEVPFAAAYRVTRKRLSDGEVDIDIVTDGTEYDDDTVSLCGKYEYAVAPLDAAEFSCAEPTVVPVYVTDGTGATASVTGLKAESAEGGIRLCWSTEGKTLRSNVYRKTPLGPEKLIASVTGNTYTDTGAIPCVPIEYSVEAENMSGAGERMTVISDVTEPMPERKMETLGRGAAAVKTDGGIFVGWRLKGCEYDKGISFIVLRNGERITDAPLTKSTSMFDPDGKPGDRYTIKAVKDGRAEREGETVTAAEHEYIPIPIDKPEPYTAPDGSVFEYYAGDVIPADLDGDGEYELVVKWMANPKDNSHKGYTGIYYIDAYKLDGEKLWRICLGRNIRCGAHYAQLLVYDLDSDGKAELICKTADGTTDAAGTVIGDAEADYRNKDGFIIEGPEYLSAFDGETGTLLDTVPYDPPRGNVSDWGDSWGNRVDRFLACIAYLDGVNPSAVMCRGYYDHGRPTVLAAYDLKDKKLVKRWVFRADKDHNINYTAQGNHSLCVGDIDGDGMDEIVYGAMAVDNDGRGIYSTGLGHGDAQHLGKFLPHEDGLQYFEIHEEDEAEYGYEVHDPATGEIKWGVYTGRDTARGMCAKIDPRYEGNQVWAIGEPLYTFEGDMISEDPPKTCKFTVWWDGDLLRELLDYAPDDDWWENGSPRVYKWNWKKGELETVFAPDGAKCIRNTKGTPCLQADILGDWREELIYTNDDCTELRIYTATTVTEHRIYTLMHDHVYRTAIALQNTAYNTPPHTGFYIGPEMEKPEAPRNSYVRGGELPEFVDEI